MEEKEIKDQEINETRESMVSSETSESGESNETSENSESGESNETSEPTIEEQLAKARQDIADLKNDMLYKQAEFDNYRKRTMKEKADLILNGGLKTITAILPVLDDMERAIMTNEKSEDIDAAKEGFCLIYKKFQKILSGLGVKEIDTKDADFNVDFHEAIARLPMGDDKKGKVIDCTQKGYTLNDKVIRYAKVAVGE